MSTPSNRTLRNRLIRSRNLHLATEQDARHAASETAPALRRWTRRQWAQVSLIATMVALLGTLVPGFSSMLQPPGSTPIQTLSLKLPPLSRSRAAGTFGDSWHTVTVRRGASLGHMFSTLGIPRADLDRVLAHPGVKAAIGQITPQTQLSVDLPVNGKLRALRFVRADGQRVQLDLTGKDIRETLVKRDVDVRTVVLSGKVGRSLFRSAHQLGLSGAHLDQLTDEMFKYDIDFDSDLDADDRFSVVVDQMWVDGELERTGPILAAAFTVDGRLHTAFRHTRNGKPEYFTSDGRPLKRAFIRMPIPYARLSSSFGNRFHPVLGRMRMHKGVDYAAGTGTPIQAAGDARVQFMGWQNGYGRVVILDHGHGYTTLYGHMSRFGNIRQGQSVAQGTTIGYVGMTGLATGPHLHYEFRINGVHRNPLSITMPPPEPLRGAELASFRNETLRAMTKIRTVENIVFPQSLEAPQQALAVALATDRPAQKPKKKG
ncbi:MAG: peptidoglycan DD-metalloendopeptidase family protein [Lysobacteraceae bacterium]